MSNLPDRPEMRGGQPFHTRDGKHRFPHPGTYMQRSAWTTWERKYAAHLDRHEELARNPEPQDGDSRLVLDLFAHIEHLQKIIEKEKLLILALRQRQAAYPEADEADMPELRESIKIRKGGTGS